MVLANVVALEIVLITVLLDVLLHVPKIVLATVVLGVLFHVQEIVLATVQELVRL